MEKNNGIQVIGAGNGRTGTSSLKKALEILGYDPCYHMKEVFARNHFKFWRKLTNNESYNFKEVFHCGEVSYQASCDFPSAFFWKEQLESFPDAKVILTVRDPEKWYKSCCDTIFQMNPGSPFSNLGAEMIGYLCGSGDMLNQLWTRDFLHNNWDKENVIKCFIERNNRVLTECPAGKLLVYETGQGWEPICTFLGKPIPDVPYPNVNDTKEFQRMVKIVSSAGYVVISVPIAVVALLAWKVTHSIIAAADGGGVVLDKVSKVTLPVGAVGVATVGVYGLVRYFMRRRYTKRE